MGTRTRWRSITGGWGRANSGVDDGEAPRRNLGAEQLLPARDQLRIRFHGDDAAAQRQVVDRVRSIVQPDIENGEHQPIDY